MNKDCATGQCFERLCRASCAQGGCEGTAGCQEGYCIDPAARGQDWVVGVTRVFGVPPGNEVNEPEPIACISAGARRVCSAEGSGVDATVNVAFAASTDELSALQLDIYENDALLGAFGGCREPCADGRCDAPCAFEPETFEHPISVVVDVRPLWRRVHSVRLDHFELVVSP